MKAVIQRVKSAVITIEHAQVREIGEGLAVFLCVVDGDADAQADFLARKIAGLRIFTDKQNKMNLSVQDIGGDVLVVSNFTLCADCKKGFRPSFDRAARPGEANRLYERFIAQLRPQLKGKTETGVFGAHMDVDLKNNGPVTIIIDTEAIGKGN